jgi:hypothetical protein
VLGLCIVIPQAMVGPKSLDAMVVTGLIDNFVTRGVFGPGSFVHRILYTRSHATKYSSVEMNIEGKSES